VCLEPGHTVWPLHGSLSLPAERDARQISDSVSTWIQGLTVGVRTRGSPLIFTQHCLIPRPYRCLATVAAGNKGCLSRKGEGSRPQTRSHLSSFPPLPQWLPGEEAWPWLGRGRELDPAPPSFARIPPEHWGGAGVKVLPNCQR
jgi:hypothetical protein